MEIKVQCDCGTRYKFDVEPVNGRMPGPVQCPVCGADGTAAAEATIQESLAVPALMEAPAAAPVPAQAVSAPQKPRIRLNVTAPAPAPDAPVEEAPQSSEATPVAHSAPAPPGSRMPQAAAAALAAPAGAPARKGNFGLGILGAVLGTLVSVGIWLVIFYSTDLGSRGIIKLFAIGVGFLAGLGARFLGRDEGSKELGSITAAIAFIGIFAAQYLIAKEQIVGRLKKEVKQEYQERLTYAKKAVQAVPNGTDQEIRDFLVKTAAADGDKLKAADVTSEDIQEFREKELPELRDLANGKISQAKFNKDSGVEELEENSGIKLLIAIRGLGLFTIGAMIIAVGTAYKMAATDA